MESDDENVANTIIKNSKGKHYPHAYRSDVLELKPRKRRQGKCVGAALDVIKAVEDQQQQQQEIAEVNYTYISNDIWYNLANYIRPEDVKSYALICKQSASSVQCCQFWRQLYRRYCLRGSPKNGWILQLPDYLQADKILKCWDLPLLQERVIKALYYCHHTFVERLKTHYSLDILIGRLYVSSWYINLESVWIMCYKFRQNSTNLPKVHYTNENEAANGKRNIDDFICDNWESLVEEDHKIKNIKNNVPSQVSHSSSNLNEGVSLLIICCDRFIPFPSQLLYDFTGSMSTVRLEATRELLSTDMRNKNLELDFSFSIRRNQTITLKYLQIKSFKVLPWWHPDFKRFVK